ncbi:MAG: ectonucleotide pyrophosphatase/phosphodiesterase [Vicinamibacterales bacterium]
MPIRRSRRARALSLVLGVLALAACQPAPVPAAPIVIMVGIDGWRADYFGRYPAPAIEALAARGVRAEALTPSFPSKTFPNHYTLATGLIPAHNGIIANNMEDPEVPGRFRMADREVIADPRWWKGEPIWLTAERQGIKAAPYFWPGSEAPIGGHHATYWLPFDNDLADDRRVAQVLDWLRLPEPERPRMLTLYFSDLDVAGHGFGPDSGEVRDAVARVDTAVASLVRGVAAAGLADRVHYVLVSDHGMAGVPADHVLVLDEYLDLDTVDILEWTPILMVKPKDGGDPEALYQALVDRHPAMRVYRKAETPERWGLREHPRATPVIAILDEGWTFASRRDVEGWATGARHRPGGNHGYDPETAPSMGGLFVAAGPRLKQGLVVPAFQNTHVYDLLCALLDLIPAPNDGDAAVTTGMLR